MFLKRFSLLGVLKLENVVWLLVEMGDIEIYIYDNCYLKYHVYCKYHDIK